MRESRRGAVIIFALLLVLLTTLIGLSLIGMRKGHYSASQLALRSAQAKYLAHSGIHDAVAKLSKDPFFPSGVGDDQTYFTYKEPLREDGTDKVIGYYQVTVDQFRREEFGIVALTSVGQTAFSGETPARHATYVEFSIRPASFGVILWKEGRPPTS